MQRSRWRRSRVSIWMCSFSQLNCRLQRAFRGSPTSRVRRSLRFILNVLLVAADGERRPSKRLSEGVNSLCSLCAAIFVEICSFSGRPLTFTAEHLYRSTSEPLLLEDFEVFRALWRSNWMTSRERSWFFLIHSSDAIRTSLISDLSLERQPWENKGLEEDSPPLYSKIKWHLLLEPFQDFIHFRIQRMKNISAVKEAQELIHW